MYFHVHFLITTKKLKYFLLAFWQNHQEVGTVKWIQAKSTDDAAAPYEGEKEVFESSEEEIESEENTEEESDSDNPAAVQANKFSALNDE